MRYTVAAEGSRPAPRGGLDGSLVERARPLQMLPVGTVHAVALGADGSLCGLQLRALAHFSEWDFETNPGAKLKCEDCVAEILRRDQASAEDPHDST